MLICRFGAQFRPPGARTLPPLYPRLKFLEFIARDFTPRVLWPFPAPVLIDALWTDFIRFHPIASDCIRLHAQITFSRCYMPPCVYDGNTLVIQDRIAEVDLTERERQRQREHGEAGKWGGERQRERGRPPPCIYFSLLSTFFLPSQLAPPRPAPAARACVRTRLLAPPPPPSLKQLYNQPTNPQNATPRADRVQVTLSEVKHQEFLQVLNYQPGQFYRQHHDFIESAATSTLFFIVPYHLSQISDPPLKALVIFIHRTRSNTE